MRAGAGITDEIGVFVVCVDVLHMPVGAVLGSLDDSRSSPLK